MKRSKKTAAAVAVLAAAAPGAAWAVTAVSNPVQEVGLSTDDPAPSCPASPCKVLPRTTAYQVKVGEERDVDTVKSDGKIVAWTVKMSKPGPTQVKYFKEHLGGDAQAQITVIRPGNKQYARVLAQGDPVTLTPYFGQRVTFALSKAIPVKKGNVIGITTPTWAPLLAVGQPGTTSWRGTRGKGQCNEFTSQTAQTKTNNITRFYCLYRTARLAFSATVIPDPKPNKK